MESTENIIYGLVDPRTADLRYIGLTKRSTRRRLLEHINMARRGSRFHLHVWIRTLLAVGLEPQVIIFDKIENREEACLAECSWIAKFRKSGARLTNITDGGEGSVIRGKPRSDECKAKISASLRGHKLSEEHKKKIGDRFRGKKLSQEHVAKVAAANTGKKRSIETKKRLSISHKGKPIPAEQRKKISDSLSGRTAHNKGKPMSAEVRAKMAASHMGMIFTEERKANISAARRAGILRRKMELLEAANDRSQ